MFFRRETDGTRVPVDLRDLYSSSHATSCWIIGGGPSLTAQDAAFIAASPAPRFTVNLAGSGLLRPQFWTSYDPTARFHRSIYLDASILKFVHEARAMDLVPGGREKVCDCPGLLFFSRDRQQGFHSFLTHSQAGIVDWQDSFVQAIDIAYQLGFRELLLAGCDMGIAPSPEWQQQAAARGVDWQPGELLREFRRRCERAGLSRAAMQSWCMAGQYHFDEAKPLPAAEQTDFHYFRVSQYLRLSRRAISRAGLQLVSVSPGSRLNEDFPFQSVPQAASRILALVGDPAAETTRGRYTNSKSRSPVGPNRMRDFKPHFWDAEKKAKSQLCLPEVPSREPSKTIPWETLREVAVDIREEG